MAKDWTAVPVPAPPLIVHEFLKIEQDRFIHLLQT